MSQDLGFSTVVAFPLVALAEPPGAETESPPRSESSASPAGMGPLWYHWMGLPPVAVAAPGLLRPTPPPRTHGYGQPNRCAAPQYLRAAALPVPLLVVVAQTLHAEAVVTSLGIGHTNERYLTKVAVAHGVEDISNAVNAVKPRLVIIEPDALGQLSAAEMKQLRRRFDDTEWVIVWRDAPPHWIDFITMLGARGIVELGNATSRVSAIDAILAGNLWFPRWVFNSLYSTLLGVLWAGAGANQPAHLEGAPDLTRRESDVFALVHEGLSNKQIARRLSVGVNTIKKHLKSIFEKRGLSNRRQVLSLVLVWAADFIDLELECLCLLA